MATKIVKKTKDNVQAKTTQAKPKLETSKLELLVTIVPRNKGDFYMDIIQSFDVNMQMSLLGNGTAPIQILDIMGLSADSKKAIILSIIKEEKIQDAMATLENKFKTIRGGKGISYSIPLSSVIGVAVYGFLANNKKTIKE